MISASPQAPSFPPRIGEYELVREIGRGAMGSIHLARDTLLEREVALKLIAAEDLDDEAKALFFREARALARVSHINVVTVYRVGEIERQPYLVTELVKGASLEALDKPVRWTRALALGLGVARGLEAAHKRNILHRDIKPANIMLAEEGEVKLVDFGLAKVLGDLGDAEPGSAPRLERAGARRSAVSRVSRSGEIAGTPLYMAPEVLLGQGATRASDIYGVGAVLYELLTGVAPRDALPEDLPISAWIAADAGPIEARLLASGGEPRFTRLVLRCLARSPADRFSSAGALVEAMEALGDSPEDEGEPTDNPYRGLEPFEIQHRGLFFGREIEAREVMHRLRREAIVVVAGDSGVGKSSLCKAGVLPRLARDATERGRICRVIAIVPGARPLLALDRALAEILPPGAAKPSSLLDGDRAELYRALSQGLAANEDLLLFVDQLEELCTLSDPEEAARFGEALLRVAEGPRARVLSTLRGDFITSIAAIGDLGAGLAASLYLLRPMSEEGVRAAIVKPALRRGITFESEDLVDELSRAAMETAGGLPLLEFTLAELWAARDEARGVLTARSLRAMGSVAGALVRHADAVLAALDDQGKLAARRVLLKLTHTDFTRARRTWEELDGDRPETGAAIQALVRGRLLLARKLGQDRAYEVTHEALLREWQTLRRWIEETKEQGQLLQEIEQAAELWDRRGRRDDETWSGEALAQAAQRVERWSLDLPPISRAFLDAGTARMRAIRRRRGLLIGGGAGALFVIAVASTLAAFAFAEKEKLAIRQQDQIRLAAADMGEIELVIEPFDWDAERGRATPAALPITADWRLHGVSASDARAPGRLYGSDDLRRSSRRIEGTVIREHVEARSGPALLEVTGRGEGCASSWIYLRRLPGYPDRVSRAPAQVRIAVPTCRATREGMIEIPAGEFYRAVPVDAQSAEWRDEPASLPAFFIDRTEVTRGAHAMYAAMESLTGDVAARTGYLDMDRPGGERLPIVGVNAIMAAAYCRFLGKELPSADQWLKAMRGGLTVDGSPNPAPKRDTPWPRSASKTPSNILYEGEGDGFPNLAPVGSFPEDKSPYGLLDLGGNVSEWTRDVVDLPQMKGLRYVLGANWGSPPEHAHWGNMRPDLFLDFGIGLRCAR